MKFDDVFQTIVILMGLVVTTLLSLVAFTCALLPGCRSKARDFASMVVFVCFASIVVSGSMLATMHHVWSLADTPRLLVLLLPSAIAVAALLVSRKKGPNQPPEPTATSVTPPAAQESRQP